MSGYANRNGDLQSVGRVPEERYSYYRRCQVFRRNGEQCKAPAEKGGHICYAHAGQQATELRRRLELAVVLAESARRMRQRGRPDFEVADIFMDFNAIQVTLGVMARALIAGRIDSAAAGRLLVTLQTAAKLLRIVHSKGREGRNGTKSWSQGCAAERRFKTGLATKDTREQRGPEAASKQTFGFSDNEATAGIAGSGPRSKAVVIGEKENPRDIAAKANAPPGQIQAA